MKKFISLMLLLALVVLPASLVLADDASIDQEIDTLKSKISKLEKKAVNSPKASSACATDGLMISGGITTVLQASHDANATSYEGEDVTDATYSVDVMLEKAVGDTGKVFVTLEAGGANGLDGEEVVLLSGVNGDAIGSTDVQVATFGYEMTCPDGKGTLTVGKLDIDKYFDTNAVANDETSQFLAQAFVNSTVIAKPGYALGAVADCNATDMISVQAGIFEKDSDFEDVFNDNFMFAQVSVSPELQGKAGTYRIYGWYDTASYVKFDDMSKENERNYGFGLSADQVLTDNVTAFARVGTQQEDVAALKLAWSLGAGIAGSAWDRADDVVGVAVGQNVPSSKYGDLGNPDNKETQFEAYYSLKVNDCVTISPDLQVIWNPNGVKEASEGRKDTVVVGGVRAQLDF